MQAFREPGHPPDPPADPPDPPLVYPGIDGLPLLSLPGAGVTTSTTDSTDPESRHSSRTSLHGFGLQL